MSRFYSQRRRQRHNKLPIALMLALSFGLACGPTAKTPKEPGAAASVKTLIERAQQAERKRQYNDARALYLRAIDESPDASSAAIANRELASALAFWGEYRNAEARLLTSLAHDERQARVWHDLGVLQVHLKKSEAALTSLQRAVQLAPTEPRARRSYAALLVKRKLYTRAIEQYETLLTLPIPQKIEDAANEAIRLLRAELALKQ